MLDVVLTNNLTIDIARYAASKAASEMFGRRDVSVSTAVETAMERALLFAEIRDKIMPDRTDGQRYWVWRCEKCGGWHATIGLPDGECFGPTAEALEEAGEALARSGRKGSKSAAWDEAEIAAKLLGLDTCPSDAERDHRWPDLGALWQRLEVLEQMK